jgi:hypothetical protein
LTLVNFCLSISVITLLIDHALSTLWFLSRSRRLLWINVYGTTSCYGWCWTRLHSHKHSCSNGRLTSTSCSHTSVRSSATISLFKKGSLIAIFIFGSWRIGLILSGIKRWCSLIGIYLGTHYEGWLRWLKFPRSMNLWATILKTSRLRNVRFWSNCEIWGRRNMHLKLASIFGILGTWRLLSWLGIVLKTIISLVSKILRLLCLLSSNNPYWLSIWSMRHLLHVELVYLMLVNYILAASCLWYSKFNLMAFSVYFIGFACLSA